MALTRKQQLISMKPRAGFFNDQNAFVFLAVLLYGKEQHSVQAKRESEEGQGASFIITLPMRQTEADSRA